MRDSEGSAEVVINLRIRRLVPLTGTAATEDAADLVFEGWMELMGAIAEIVGSPDHTSSVDRRPRVGSGEEGAGTR